MKGLCTDFRDPTDCRVHRGCSSCRTQVLCSSSQVMRLLVGCYRSLRLYKFRLKILKSQKLAINLFYSFTFEFSFSLKAARPECQVQRKL